LAVEAPVLTPSPAHSQRLAERLPKGAAVVSATNGKTTTAKMAASILSPPLRLCRNAAGANLASGVASAMLRGGPADLGLFEVDEAALPAVAEALVPRALVLGNLFRDQLDRYGELELVAAGWRDLAARLGPATTLVSNADDPLVASIGRDRERHTWFGLDDALEKNFMPPGIAEIVLVDDLPASGGERRRAAKHQRQQFLERRLQFASPGRRHSPLLRTTPHRLRHRQRRQRLQRLAFVRGPR
jgi:UDP-N-acetylmuramyl tripeptide synthase